MRRVCCFCERWESGGIESFLCNVLTRMDMTDLEMDIVASSIGESVFTDPLRQHGVRFFELSGSQRDVLENHRRFRELVRERKYDVLHLNAFQGLSLAYLKIAEREGVPVRIAHSHNTALRKSATRPVKQLLHEQARRRYIRYATDLWACSKNAAEFLFGKRELQKRGYTFIPNGIDVERFRFDPAVRAKVRAELDIENKFVIGHIGRLCCQKNQTFLLNVLAEAVKQNPNAVLLFVGGGEDKPALLKKAANLGITDKVIFYGTTSRPERLLWAMDAFAFPSLFEGFGIVAIEALAAGLPVVCSENVPAEVRVSRHIQPLPLSRGPRAWAEALLHGHRHESGSREISAAGFDVRAVSAEIWNRFRGMSNGPAEDIRHSPRVQCGALSERLPGQRYRSDL